MSDQSTNLHLPYLASGQAQKHVTVNEGLRKLDAIVQLSVVSATTTAEPVAPTDGARYILPSGKTGAHWGAMTTHAVAYYRDGAWEEIAPREGWLANVDDIDQMLVYAGAAWAGLSSRVRISATDRVLGRVSSGAGAAEEVTFTDQAQALCDDTSFAAMRATMGAAGLTDANLFSADQASSTYVDWAFMSGNAYGRVSGRYDMEGGAHDALALSCNFKWDTGARDNSALGTSMLTLKGTNSGEGIIEFWTGAVNAAPTKRVLLSSAGLRPATDNVLSLGGASERWSVVYAATGTINTSDAREKTPLQAIPESVKRAVRRVLAGVGVYQWLASVAEKGDAARLHVGFTAQAVRDAFEAEGENPARWALFCEDPLYEVEEKHAVHSGPETTTRLEPRPARDDDGKALTRLGVRTDQLFALALAVVFEDRS